MAEDFGEHRDPLGCVFLPPKDLLNRQPLAAHFVED
jgi:hypothetical protein